MASFSIDIGYYGNGLSEPDIAVDTLVAGYLCYLNNDSKYYKSSASSKLTSTTEVRMALSYIPINTSGMFLIRGKFTMAGLTAGDKYYISEALGQCTNVQPNGTATNVIRDVGTAYSSKVLEFNVDETYVWADGSELNEVTLPAGGGGSGHVIQYEGVSMNARTNLNFIGSAVSVSDNPGTSSTNVTIVDSGAHVHTNLPLLETYDQTNVDIANAVVNAHTVYSLGTKTVTETGLTNGDVLRFNSTSGLLEYVAQTGGVTDHTALTSIGTNTHSQIDTHIANGTIHYTQAAISIAESQVVDLVGKYELALGNPAADGYVLTSTAGGVRTWENISSGGPEADTLDSVNTRGSTTNNSLSTGTLDVTGNVGSKVRLKPFLYNSDADIVIDSPTVSNTLSLPPLRH